MKFFKFIFVTFFTIVLIGVASYVLATTGIKSKPGYANWVLPSWSLSDTRIAIKVGPVGVKSVRWIVEQIVLDSHADVDVSQRALLGVLKDVDGLQLRIYQVTGNRQKFDQALQASVTALKQEAWETIVSVREDNEHVVVMQSQAAGIISGVTVMVNTPDESIFINLVGQFDPQEIVAYAESL